jgi:hypothetical protein
LVPRRVAVSGVSGWTALATWVFVSRLRHHRISRQHLPYYLDEFTFRFNRGPPELAAAVLPVAPAGRWRRDPHPLSELIGGTGNDWDESTSN